MKTQQVIFAAGCFWGVQYYFDQVPGVVKTTVGYTGGHTEYPTYDDVASRMTGHAEATLVEYDPEKVSYKTLLLQFFRMHDPTTIDRQGPDIGDEYRSAIFYFDPQQHQQAVEVRNARQKEIDKPIVTEIEPAGPFYPAEEYHQKFTEKTGIGMCHIPYAPVGVQNTK
ncbi:MAG TPA: peptide-methionine (S)-S-oxide reductase MsrA [Candidatus Saccharimonadales bacterium]|jgi:methionine-S-sulfoxide reductase|nr:peptide-methionine (S)-S-oxide reductase MsrA [Candidatus Saccharimonadales bacterium]